MRVLQLRRHVIHGLGQAPQLFGGRHRQFAVQVPQGKAPRPPLQILQRAGETPGNNEAQDGHQQGNAQRSQGNSEIKGPEGLGHGGHGHGGPHHPDDPVLLPYRHRHIHQVVAQGEAKPGGDADAALQGGLNLRTVPVILHARRVFVRIAHHRPGRQDNGEAGSGEPAQFLAQLVQGRAPGGSKLPPDVRLHQASPVLQIPGSLRQIKLAPGPGGIPGHRQQGDERDQQIRRKKLPDQPFCGP